MSRKIHRSCHICTLSLRLPSCRPRLHSQVYAHAYAGNHEYGCQADHSMENDRLHRLPSARHLQGGLEDTESEVHTPPGSSSDPQQKGIRHNGKSQCHFQHPAYG